MNYSQIKNIEDLQEAMKECTSFSKAIKLKCLDCSAYQHGEIKECRAKNCPLWPFRMGHNPFTKRVVTEEQKEKARQRLMEYHNNKH